MNRDQARQGSQSAPALDVDAPHIMVVDDDDRLRKLLRRYLSENGYRVTTAGTAAEAESKLVGLAFDLLVLDVMMPGESGVALTKRLRERMSVPILLLTAMGEPEDRISGLESGADDYLTKPFEPRELLLRIATILRRTRVALPPAGEAPVRIGGFEFHPARAELARGGESVRLTHTESQLLTIFVGQLGVTRSREELGRHCGIDAGGRASDVQIARLRRKIEPDPSAPRYLLTVWGEGYTLRAV